ncbi:MAG: hypothetical protein IT580_00710 [Verrucomicrobiales bacterium]|nr:hypothetical protein [Verrucomicrobiales bacterium]
MQLAYPSTTTWWILALFATVIDADAQNLVTNPGFESGNKEFTTDYPLWNRNPNWGANQYVVTNNPHNTTGAWISAVDHTTGSGQMLIVDGSTSAGQVFWRQTVSVQANTTYVFSTWALKFESQSPPILYFSVNGKQQGTFYVLPVTPSGWQAFGVTWNSATSNTALLEMRLQSTAGVGNNIAVDDIAFIRSSDVPATQATAFTAVQIGWLSYPGSTYQVQWSPEVDTETWIDLGNRLVGNGVTNYVCDPLGAHTRRYYQVLRVD